MNLRHTLCLITLAVLSGCNQESAKEPEQHAPKPQTVQDRIAEKNAQQWKMVVFISQKTITLFMTKRRVNLNTLFLKLKNGHVKISPMRLL